MNDGFYGSVFFLLTGFHGFHVFVGSVMIFWSLVRLAKFEGSRLHHIGVESAIIYWHFVDVVWLFLYVGVYLWIQL